MGIDSVDPAIFGLAPDQRASTVILCKLHFRGRRCNCDPTPQRPLCGKLRCHNSIRPKFMTLDEYAATMTPAALAAEVERE